VNAAAGATKVLPIKAAAAAKTVITANIVVLFMTKRYLI
jgi:hypothetical protein